MNKIEHAMQYMETYTSIKAENNLLLPFETDFFQKESQINQVLIIIAEKPRITQEEISVILQEYCYTCPLVPDVPDVPDSCPPLSSSKKNIGDKRDTGDRGTVLSSLKESIKKCCTRLVDRNTILVDKSNKQFLYSISSDGDKTLVSMLKTWLDGDKRAQLKEKTRTNASKIYYAFDEYFSRIIDKIATDYTSGKCFAEIVVPYLAKIDPYVAEILLENPIDTLKIAKITLKEHMDRYALQGEPNITIASAPKDCRRNITNIRSKDLDKILTVMGEIRSRGNSNIQITSIRYECPSCGAFKNIIQTSNRQISPKSCPNCKYKGKQEEAGQEKEDFLRLTIYDLYENIASNEVPEELNIYLQKDLYGFSFLKEGDKVELTGISSIDEKTDGRGNKLLYQPKIFRAYGLKKLDNNFADDFVTAKDDEQMKVIAANPLEYHKKLLFSDLHDIDFPATLASICLYGNHNLLFVGKPGCGKTEISSRITKVSLKGKFANCATSSSSGILGSVTKNEFTGKYTLDGGVFRPIHPGGHVVLDEINRDNERELQKCILGIMNDKRININKANTRIDEPCEVSVWCTANPTKLSAHIKPFDVFGLLEPLYDRFDFVIYFSNELDWQDITLVEKLLNDSSSKFVLNQNDVSLLRKYQMKAQQIEVILTESDFQKLSLLMQQVLPNFDEKLTYRRLKTITNLLKSICRLHLRNHSKDEDYILITDIFRELKQQREIFNSKYLHGEEKY